MARHNSTDPAAAQVRYSTVAIVLHWLLALGLTFQVALGFAMPHRGPESFVPMQLHKSVGIAILLLTLVRIAWRLTHRPPPAVEGGFNGFLAKAVHTLFYVVLIVGPLSGWAIVSTASIDVPTVLFGLVPWPHLPLSASVNGPAEALHEWLGWIAIALFVLHVLGALRHHILLSDGLLRRMAPAGSVIAVFGLLLGTLALFFATGSYVAGTYLVPAMEREQAEREAAAEAPAAAPAAVAAPEETPTPEAEPSEAAAEEEEQTAAAGPPPVWTIQPGKRLAFSLGGPEATINGTFSDWSGTIRFDPDNPETADLRISVDLASASLGDATQDGMLQGGDFFATAAHPTATWRSTSVRQTGPGRYSAQGTLSLKGVSRPQTVTFRLTGSGMRRHAEGSATIDRTAFGVGTGEAAAGLAGSVSLSFAFDAVGREP